MLHWQTCSIISRVPSVASCSELPCLLDREAFLTLLIGTPLSALQGLTTATAIAEL